MPGKLAGRKKESDIEERKCNMRYCFIKLGSSINVVRELLISLAYNKIAQIALTKEVTTVS